MMGWVWLCPLVAAVDVQLHNKAEVVLHSLLQGPLAKDHILLALDSGARNTLNTDAIMARRGTAERSVVIVVSDDAEDFFLKTSPQFLRGNLLVAVLVLTASPQQLLNSLDHRWNPQFLLLFNLNATLDSKVLLQDERIQRCRHIALIEPAKRFIPPRFQVFTSMPYKSLGQGPAVKFPLGLWSERNFALKPDLFPERFTTFDGTQLHLGSWCDDFPFLYPEKGVCVGSSLDLLHIMATKLNFTYNVQMEPADHNWGSKENGTWTGMLGDLIYNDADLVINVFQLTEEIFAEFDISYPYHVESYVFLLVVPPPVPQWRGLSYSFTATVWLAIILTIVLVTVLLTVCLLLVPDQQDPSMVFLLIISGAARQGVKHNLWASWTRLWVGWWWLACVIITTAYTSNLVAFLTVPVYPTRIETVEQLAASGLRLCMQDYGSFVPDTLKVSKDPSLFKLGNNLDLFPYAYLQYDVGFNWVTNGTHALVETYSYLAYLVGLYGITPNTYIMKETVYPGYLSWILRRNCPYTTRLAEVLTRLLEAGLVDRLYFDHMEKSQGSGTHGYNRHKVSGGSGLQVGQMLGAFMLWGLGLALSVVVLLLELLATWNNPPRNVEQSS
ncbi:Glutamate receptor ionotropic, delta-2-like 12 [Homarus americanus]|uniref:Glutamate receptor ionotropic, delta-2-like 12 n=1 Tax=Homarus americanus TaxID=6706 RepID=A0A8J5JS35_HOMAM|nr:Glutamate receptor ionotropic, delta-2-like 12 [Homarus americanus]